MRIRPSLRAAATALLLSTAVASTLTPGAAGANGARPDQPGGPTDVAAPFDPGVDPPYDPSRELDDLKAPWDPPTGPKDLTSEPHPGPPDGPDSLNAPKGRNTPVERGCVGGTALHLSYEYGDFLPMYGWRVRLYIYDDGIGGTLINEVVLPVDRFGEWQYCPSGLAELGKPFVHMYESVNDWVELIDPRDPKYYGPYIWSPSGAKKPPQPGVYLDVKTLDVYPYGKVLATDKLDTGAWSESNLIYGVADVMKWAMDMLTTVDHAGLRAYRTFKGGYGTHRIVYPNLYEDCSGIDNWSCYADSFNTIYLAHRYDHVERFTVQHEIGHSLVDEYWAGVESDGGVHHLDSCSTKPSLAYSEAIAHFLAIWSHTPNASEEPAVNGDAFNIEYPSVPCVVTDGNASEEYVAAALWDIHDHHADGDDTLGAADWAGVAKMVLLKPHEDALTLRGWYSKQYPAHIDWIDAVFDQNHVK